jgi:hypothetical protein
VADFETPYGVDFMAMDAPKSVYPEVDFEEDAALVELAELNWLGG